MRSIPAYILAVVFVFSGVYLPADDTDESAAAPNLKPLFTKLAPLFKQYYPKAKPTFKNNRIHVEFNTRVYLIHSTNFADSYYKDAHEEIGPQGPSRNSRYEKQGGVVCDISTIKGPYSGQYGGGFPVEFSKYYFTRLWSNSFSESLNHSLNVELLFAKDINPEFKRKFLALVADFDKAIAQPEERRNVEGKL